MKENIIIANNIIRYIAQQAQFGISAMTTETVREYVKTPRGAVVCGAVCDTQAKLAALQKMVCQARGATAAQKIELKQLREAATLIKKLFDSPEAGEGDFYAFKKAAEKAEILDHEEKKFSPNFIGRDSQTGLYVYI